MRTSDPSKVLTADKPMAQKSTRSGLDAFAWGLKHAQARHAAITPNLYSLANYKSWAEKMRHSWRSDDDKS